MSSSLLLLGASALPSAWLMLVATALPRAVPRGGRSQRRSAPMSAQRRVKTTPQVENNEMPTLTVSRGMCVRKWPVGAREHGRRVASSGRSVRHV